jgi:hypothetical protein
MHKETFFLLTFILVAIIALLHSLAYVFFWYWTLWWFDILMHFLGGVWVALTALWFFYLSGYVQRPKANMQTYLLITLGSIAVIGIAWEIFELFVGAYREEHHVLDTTVDLIMDIVGSLAGLFFFLKIEPNLTSKEKLNGKE